jgi:hypothetical protein
MHLESVWVHWLHRATCLVAEVESAFVLPLRRAFDTAIKAERLPIGINNLQATQASIGHNFNLSINAKRACSYSLQAQSGQRTPCVGFS